MKTIREIFAETKQWFADYRKKRYIRGELIEKFKQHNNRNTAYRKLLTESLLKSSKIVKAEILMQEQRKLESENMILFSDVKNVIEKHFEKRISELKRENEMLTNKVKSRDLQLKKKPLNTHNMSKRQIRG